VALDPQQLVFLAVIGVLTGVFILYRRKIADWLIGTLRGGGPRPPSHPLPGDVGFVVLRKRRRVAPGR
jgi:hypothetical protein